MSGSNIDRQIRAALDQIHRELIQAAPCRWAYDGATDIYQCPHLTLPGRDVIARVQRFNNFPLQG